MKIILFPLFLCYGTVFSQPIVGKWLFISSFSNHCFTQSEATIQNIKDSIITQPFIEFNEDNSFNSNMLEFRDNISYFSALNFLEVHSPFRNEKLKVEFFKEYLIITITEKAGNYNQLKFKRL